MKPRPAEQRCVGVVDARDYLSELMAFTAELERDGEWGFFQLASGMHVVLRKGAESFHKVRMQPVDPRRSPR